MTAAMNPLIQAVSEAIAAFTLKTGSLTTEAVAEDLWEAVIDLDVVLGRLRRTIMVTPEAPIEVTPFSSSSTEGSAEIDALMAMTIPDRLEVVLALREDPEINVFEDSFAVLDGLRGTLVYDPITDARVLDLTTHIGMVVQHIDPLGENGGAPLYPGTLQRNPNPDQPPEEEELEEVDEDWKSLTAFQLELIRTYGLGR